MLLIWTGVKLSNISKSISHETTQRLLAHISTDTTEYIITACGVSINPAFSHTLYYLGG